MGKEWIVYIVELAKFWLMEKEEKAKVILDYDEYQELLERARWSDLKARSIEDEAFDKVTKECEKRVNKLREKIASLEKDNSDLCSALSNINVSYESLKHDCVDIMNVCRKEGYIDFTSIYGNRIYREVMDSLDKSLKTIPALSFWNYFTGKADRVFCDKIRTCVGSGITNAFSRILEQIKL